MLCGLKKRFSPTRSATHARLSFWISRPRCSRSASNTRASCARGVTRQDDYWLFVREARTGSIVTDLVTFATQPQILAPAAPVSARIRHRTERLVRVFQRDQRRQRHQGIAVRKIQEGPAAAFGYHRACGQRPRQQHQHHGGAGAVIMVHSSFNSTEANAGQNVLRRHIEHIPLPTTGIHRDQVL